MPKPIGSRLRQLMRSRIAKFLQAGINGDMMSGGIKENMPRGWKSQNRRELLQLWIVRGILVSRLKQNKDRQAELTDFRIKYTKEGGVELWRHFRTELYEGLECGVEGANVQHASKIKRVHLIVSSGL